MYRIDTHNQHLIHTNIITTSDPKLGVVTASVGVEFPEWTKGLSQYHSTTAAAKRSEPDRYDANIGEHFAVARALKQIAREIEKSTRKEVRRRDLVRIKAQQKIETLKESRTIKSMRENLPA